MTAHENCGSNANKQVTCDRCGETYVCTPSSDFYCCFPEGDHSCERCLLKGMGVIKMATMRPADLSGGAT
jgi:hypothetical protein